MYLRIKTCKSTQRRIPNYFRAGWFYVFQFCILFKLVICTTSNSRSCIIFRLYQKGEISALRFNPLQLKSQQREVSIGFALLTPQELHLLSNTSPQNFTSKVKLHDFVIQQILGANAVFARGRVSWNFSILVVLLLMACYLVCPVVPKTETKSLEEGYSAGVIGCCYLLRHELANVYMLWFVVIYLFPTGCLHAVRKMWLHGRVPGLSPLPVALADTYFFLFRETLKMMTFDAELATDTTYDGDIEWTEQKGGAGDYQILSVTILTRHQTYVLPDERS